MHGIYLPHTIKPFQKHHIVKKKKEGTRQSGGRRRKGGKHVMGNRYKYNSKKFEREQTTLKHHFMPVEIPIEKQSTQHQPGISSGLKKKERERRKKKKEKNKKGGNKMNPRQITPNQLK